MSHYHTIGQVSPLTIVTHGNRKCQNNLRHYRFIGSHFIASVSLLMRLIAAAAGLSEDECFGQGHCVHGCLLVAAECLEAVFALAKKRLDYRIVVSDALAFCANCLFSSGCVQNNMATEIQRYCDLVLSVYHYSKPETFPVLCVFYLLTCKKRRPVCNLKSL